MREKPHWLKRKIELFPNEESSIEHVAAMSDVSAIQCTMAPLVTMSINDDDVPSGAERLPGCAAGLGTMVRRQGGRHHGTRAPEVYQARARGPQPQVPAVHRHHPAQGARPLRGALLPCLAGPQVCHTQSMGSGIYCPFSNSSPLSLKLLTLSQIPKGVDVI